MKKKIGILLASLVALGVLVFFLYANNTRLVNPKTIGYYQSLKETLKQRGYSPSLLVVSTRRPTWFNNLLVLFSGAARYSRHLKSEAIDFIVFDVNNDGTSNEKDVDIVYRILDTEIVKNGGGVGTYKKEGSFIYRQMVHIDCRGEKKRWLN